MLNVLLRLIQITDQCVLQQALKWSVLLLVLQALRSRNRHQQGQLNGFLITSQNQLLVVGHVSTKNVAKARVSLLVSIRGLIMHRLKATLVQLLKVSHIIIVEVEVMIGAHGTIGTAVTGTTIEVTVIVNAEVTVVTVIMMIVAVIEVGTEMINTIDETDARRM